MYNLKTIYYKMMITCIFKIPLNYTRGQKYGICVCNYICVCVCFHEHTYEDNTMLALVISQRWNYE